MGYWTVVILTIIIGAIASKGCTNALNKYRSYHISNGMTGAQAAKEMLDYYGIRNVAVLCGAEGQDFFDPRNNTITLSPSAFKGTTITATATACHEVGHACQYAQDYTPMKVRGAIVPVANIASNAWMFVLILGFVVYSASPHLGNMLVLAAVLIYACVVLFQLVTLPVEFNASNRALVYMGTKNMTPEDIAGSKKVLRACAMTYVAAALASVLQLLWIIGQARD